MSEVAVQGGRAGVITELDARRALQLALAGIWLLDGVLQYQPVMYTAAFGQSLARSADGNPAVIATPITWQAGLLEHHLALLNTIYATIQLMIGLGIAIRPTLRVAIAASIAWSLGVWWFGEGLGGVLAGTASPLGGAPGGVLLYALLAVLLWPAERTAVARTGAAFTATPFTAVPFIAARAVGVRAARALWLVLWLSLAYFAITPANRSPGAVSAMIGAMAAGEPGWLATLLRGAASVTRGADLATSVAMAVAFAVIAIGIYLPRPAVTATLLLAVVVSLAIWVFGQALGAILAGGSTDPNSGPLLVLLAAAYWPAAATRAAAAA